MSTIRFGQMTAGIDHDALEATKAAILARAENKNHTTDAIQNTGRAYSAEIKNDIMAMARVSVKKSVGNPFSESEAEKPSLDVSQTESEKRLLDENYIALKKVKEPDVSEYKSAIKRETMLEARNQFGHSSRLDRLLATINSQVASSSSAYRKAKFVTHDSEIVA